MKFLTATTFHWAAHAICAALIIGFVIWPFLGDKDFPSQGIRLRKELHIYDTNTKSVIGKLDAGATLFEINDVERGMTDPGDYSIFKMYVRLGSVRHPAYEEVSGAPGSYFFMRDLDDR